VDGPPITESLVPR